jgi:hypothetical protein
MSNVMKTISFVSAMLVGVVARTTGRQRRQREAAVPQGTAAGNATATPDGRDGARLANTALTAPRLTRYVRHPSGAMPAYIDKVITDEELADIWAYIKTLPAPKAVKDNPLLNELKGP